MLRRLLLRLGHLGFRSPAPQVPEWDFIVHYNVFYNRPFLLTRSAEGSAWFRARNGES